MATTLEERVQTLEEKIARLEKQEAPTTAQPDTPWWIRRFGAFKDSPDFDSAMRRGEEYRKAQPNPVDNPDAVTFG